MAKERDTAGELLDFDENSDHINGPEISAELYYQFSKKVSLPSCKRSSSSDFVSIRTVRTGVNSILLDDMKFTV